LKNISPCIANRKGVQGLDLNELASVDWES